MKKLIVTCLAILGISLSPAVSNADEATKIAIIDSQRLDEESKAIKSIKEQLNKKVETLKKQASGKEKEFKKRFQEIDGNKRKLSKEAFEEELGKLKKEAEEFEKKSYEDRVRIEKASAEAMAQVEKTFNSIIKDKALKDKYSLVLFKINTIYSDESLDITSSVLAELDKALPNVDVKFSK